MKKILIVMTSLYNGGAEKSLVNLLNEMDESRYQVDLLLFRQSGIFMNQIPSWVNLLETPEDLKILYTSEKIPPKGILKRIRKFVGTAISHIFTSNAKAKRGMRWKFFYSQQIDRLPEHYDVALAYVSGEVLYYVSEKVNADKKIVMVHTDYKSAQYPKKYDYPHLKNMDYIASISLKCVDVLREEFPDFSNKLILLPNLTSSKLIKKRAEEFFPKEFSKGKLTILSIGRLSLEKGFDMSIEAAAILKSKNISFEWFIIGNGILEKELKKKIKEYKVEDCIILLGTRKNPYPYIQNCDIFVQSSRFEGKSVVMDEAKILAKPIVATAYPTVHDQIGELEGLIVQISPKGIAEGIIKMINKEYRQRYSQCLCKKEYGNQEDIKLYYEVIDK